MNVSAEVLSGSQSSISALRSKRAGRAIRREANCWWIPDRAQRVGPHVARTLSRAGLWSRPMKVVDVKTKKLRCGLF